MIPLPHYTDEALREFLNRILQGDANVVIVEMHADGNAADMMARSSDREEVMRALGDAMLICGARFRKARR